MKMKALIITLIVMLVAIVSNAQSVKVDASGNYYSVAAKRDSSKARNTGKTYTDSKGQKYPVYESARGSLYIIRVSKNTGKEYKQYLKLE